MSHKIQSAAVRIRALEFDPQTRIVNVEGRKTLLDAGSTFVLSVLADWFGDSVSKDALLRAGWPNRLVHENSLAKAVSKLRRAIDGSGVEIAAIYGIGYSLREAGDLIVHTLPAVAEEPASASLRPRSVRTTTLALSMCIVLLTTAVGALLVQLRAHSVPIRNSPPVTHDAPDAAALILWVDDHPSNNSLEVEALKRRRVAVHLAESTADALKLLAINRYQMVVSDLGRGEDRLAGLRMIQAMKQRGLTTPVMIYTTRPKDHYGEETLRRMAAEAGAVDLAVTPQEVRTGILRKLATDA